MPKYDLERFVEAQKSDYEIALSEMRSGRKRSHWIWYIFPQLQGLGHSYYAKLYGIYDLDEAKEYLAHSVLGARLEEICTALLGLESSDAEYVMGGHPDDWKLKSSMTLFAVADGREDSVYRKVLDKFFGGEQDARTLSMLKE